MNLRSFKRFLGGTSKPARRNQRGKLTGKPSVPLAVEALESRELMSVVPAPIVTFPTDPATGLPRPQLDFYGPPPGISSVYAPQLVANPLNPNVLVEIHSAYFENDQVNPIFRQGELWGTFSLDGGNTWSSSSGNTVDTAIIDPVTGQPYTDITDVSVTFDRSGRNKVYVVSAQHNLPIAPGNPGAGISTSGAIVFSRYTLDAVNGFTQDSDDNLVSNRVLYRWFNADFADADPAFHPYIAIDNNEPTYVDPVTGLTHTDTLATMIDDPFDTDPVHLVPKAIYVAWNTLQAQQNQNPAFSDVFIAGSADGGHNWTTQQYLSNDSFTGRPNASEPRITFSQGSQVDPADPGAVPRVPGGTLSVLYSNSFTGGLAQIHVDQTRPDGGVAGAIPLAAQEFVGTGGSVLRPGALGPVQNTFSIPVNLNAPAFTDVNGVARLSDLDITVNLITPATADINIVLQPPIGPSFTLLQNRVDAGGQTRQGGIFGTLGLPNANDIGVITGPNNSKRRGGMVFDLDAPRIINDPTTSAPWVGHFRPEGFVSWASLYNQPLTALNGTWQLIITDFRDDGANPPPQILMDWTLHFTSKIDRNFFGFETSPATMGVAGSFSDDFPTTNPAAGPRGIPATAVHAYDNSLGSFSPYQGRMYVAYTSGTPTNTNIAVRYSDDNGDTWSREFQVNDDSPLDNFSLGTRTQFLPSIAVDPVTGAVVVSYYDGRTDASGVRVANSIAVSIDGGRSWSKSVFLNDLKTADNFIDGETHVLEPIPGNQGQNGRWGFGERQGLYAYNGRAIPVFSTNHNENISRIRTAIVSYAAGPRIVGGDMGPIAEDFINPDNANSFHYNDRFAPDGTRQLDGFVITYDRPIDPSSLNFGDITVIYRDPAGNSEDITAQLQSITPINLDQQHGAVDSPTQPTVSISDGLTREGNLGDTHLMEFTITLSQPQLSPVTIGYATQDRVPVSAQAGTDYEATTGTVTIPVGQTSAKFTVRIFGDLRDEFETFTFEGETFNVNLTEIAPGLKRARNSGLGRIVDDDSHPTVSVGDAFIHEGDNGQRFLSFPLILSMPVLDGPVSVNFGTFDGTATISPPLPQVPDYVTTNGTFVFLPGQTVGQVNVPINGDQIIEGIENFFLRLANPFPAATVALGRNQGVGNIVDDDPFSSTPNVLVSDGIVKEGNSGNVPMTFTVSLARPSPTDVTIAVTTTNGTALGGLDYVPVANQLVTIPANTTSTTFTINVIGDLRSEGLHTFNVVVNPVSPGINIVRPSAVGRIIDDDDVPVIVIGDAMVKEGDNGVRNISFPVVLSVPDLANPVTFTYATADITASGNVNIGVGDYNLTTNPFLFAPGQTGIDAQGRNNAFINIAVYGDTEVESGTLPFVSETFEVGLSNPVGALLEDGFAIGTIIEDDDIGTVPTISIGDAMVKEGDAGTTQLTFTVVLSQAQPRDVVISYATSNGTATAGQDYTGRSNVVVIPKEATSATFTITVAGDTRKEGNETVFVDLIAATPGISAGRTRGTGTIIDDDGAPALTVGDALVKEGDNGSIIMSFPITLNTPNIVDMVSVDYVLRDPLGANTATLGVDYDYVSAVHTFFFSPNPGDPNHLQGTIDVRIFGDQRIETGNEFFFLDLFDARNASLARQSALGTIVDDDQLALTIGDAMVQEGVDQPAPPPGSFINVDVPVYLNATTSRDVTFTWITEALSATPGVDYTEITNGTGTIVAGQTSTTIQVPVLFDSLSEGLETLRIRITSSTNAALIKGDAIVSLVDNDQLPNVTLGDATFREGDLPGFVRVPVYLSFPSATPVTVSYTVTSGPAIQPGMFAATQGTDYTVPAAFVVIPAGQRQAFIDIPILDDRIAERTERFTINLAAAPPGNAEYSNKTSGAVTIIDNDVSVSISDRSAPEGNVGPNGFSFTLHLSSPSDVDTVVSLRTRDGSAVSTAGGDYTAQASFQVTIPAGAVTATFNVTVLSDIAVESNEDFFVDIQSIVSGNADILKGTAHATIIDDDNQGTPVWSVGDITVFEGNAGNTLMSFVIYCFPAPGAGATIRYSTLGGNPGVEYTPASNVQATILSPFGTQITIGTIFAIGDQLQENNQAFTVTLNTPSTGVITPVGTPGRTAAGTIVDDDQQVLVFSDFSALEGNTGTTVAPVPVRLSNPIQSIPFPTIQFFDFDLADGVGPVPPGATSPVDYFYSGILSSFILSQQLGTTINTQVVGDYFFEDNENYTVFLRNPLGTVFVAKDTSNVIIVDDDDLGVAISDVAVQESAGTATFRVYLNQTSGSVVRVFYRTVAGTASDLPGIADYTPDVNFVDIPAGQTSATITIPILSDTLDEGNETFTVQITDVQGAGIVKADGVGIIVDDDRVPALTVSSGFLREQNGNMGFSVVSSFPVANPITMTVDTANLLATAGFDYTALTAFPLTIAPDTTSVNFNVAVQDDIAAEGNEDFRVTLTGATFFDVLTGTTKDATYAAQTDKGLIVDDESTVSFNIGDLIVKEGDSGRVTYTIPVILSQPVNQDVLVHYHTVNDSATAPEDYVGLAVSVGDVTQFESNGVTNVTFSVWLNSPSTQIVTAAVTTANGSALGGVDYSPLAETVIFNPGETFKTVVIAVNGDSTIELNEDFFLNITGVTGPVDIAKGQGKATLIDDDDPINIFWSIGDVSRLETNSGTAQMTFTVYLNRPLNNPSSIRYSTGGGTAIPGTDYTAASNVLLNMPAFTTSQTFTINLTTDEIEEPNKNFNVTLVTPSTGAIRKAVGVGTIIDDDQVDNVLRIPAGQTTATITVQVKGDALKEGYHQFFVELFNSVGATIAKPRAVVSIVDDDSAFGATQFLVRIAPQTRVGTYSYAVGTDVVGRIQYRDYLNTPVVGPVPLVTTQAMDQNNNSITAENDTVNAFANDRFSVPGASLENPFHGPFNPDTLPLIIPGPHVVGSGFVTKDFLEASPAAGVPSAPGDLPLTVPPAGLGGSGLLSQDQTVSKMTVAGLVGHIAALKINVHLEHANSGDLVLRLRAPNNRVVVLAQQRGSGNNFVNATFDDLSSVAIGSAAGPFGVVRPEQPLSAFNYLGADVSNGDWVLEVEDLGGAGSVGTLFNWAMSITTTNEPTYATNQYSKEVNEALPDRTDPLGNPLGIRTSTLNTSGMTGYITDVNVRVNIDYPNSGDLTLFLHAPNGTTVQLAAANGDGNFFLNTLFDDQGPKDIVAQGLLGPYTHVHPAQRLSLFNGLKGELLNGNWQLEIRGAGLIPGGLLKGWSLDIQTSAFTDNLVLNSTNDRVHVVFDRDINAVTFTAADIARFVSPVGTFNISHSMTVATPIPDRVGANPGVLNSTIFISDSFLLNGLSVFVDIVHPRPSDLSAILISPLGTQVPLFGAGPGGGFFMPTAFNGQNINGTWTLQVRDNGAGFTGVLNNWTLRPLTVLPMAGAPASMAGRAFTITFPTQGLSGSYVFNLGSDIQSGAGHRVDTNLNAGLDVLRGGSPATGVLTSKDYAWNSPPAIVEPGPNTTPLPIVIGPNSTRTVTLKIRDEFKIVQGAASDPINHIRTLLDITHQQDPDLAAVLIAPDGEEIRLFTNVVVSDRVTFDDFVNAPVATGGSTFGLGTVNPQIPLSRLQGKFTSGVWTLQITNNGSSLATLNDWQLHLPYYQSGTGLGEPVADQFTTDFRIFTMDPTQVLSSAMWTAVGPSSTNQHGIAGRVTAIAVDPSDPSGNTVYVGAASGGVWKTTNFLTTDADGPTYTPLTDLGPSNGVNIGSITVLPRNGDPRQSIIFVGTGERDARSPGIGLLRSMDGGASWQVIDSSNQNFDALGNPLPIVSAARNHSFVGMQVSKVVVDPTTLPNTPGEFAVYVVFTSNAGGTPGLYRSLDTGKTWSLMRAGNATDLVLAAASGVAPAGLLQVLYAGFEDEGVFGTTSATTTDTLVLLAGGLGKPNHVQDNGALQFEIPVLAPSSTPTGGGRGRILLATPAKTGDRLADTFLQNWLYALVIRNDAGTNYDLYMTKDRGANWTRVLIPGSGPALIPPPVNSTFNDGLGIPTNNEDITLTSSVYNPFRVLNKIVNPAFGLGFPTQSQLMPPLGNYNVALTIDPNNPNIVYFGGERLLKVDVTTMGDPWAQIRNDNSDNDGGLVQGATVGGISPNNRMIDVAVPATPGGLNDTPAVDHFNMFKDPFNPFSTNNTFHYTGLGGNWTNRGDDVKWSFFDVINDPFNTSSNDPRRVHELVAVTDPLTGRTRILLGNDQGVFTGVDRGDGLLHRGIGSADSIQGSRNGNLQIAQFFGGAVQPSTLAADVARSLFYGMALNNGVPASSNDIINTGNLNWQTFDQTGQNDMNTTAVDGNGTWIMTDATGGYDPDVDLFDTNRIGSTYQYRWPDSQTQNNLVATDFFLVDFPNGPPISRISGLLQTGDVPIGFGGQWPLDSFPGGNQQFTTRPFGRFAVNQLDPTGIVIGSTAGRVFRSAGPTDGFGFQWTPIGQPGALDGSPAQALAFGSPPITNANLNDFIYAGTNNGSIFVTFNGGGTWTNITAGLDTAGGLQPILSIVPSPRRGSQEAFAITNEFVYWRDPNRGQSTWVKLNDDGIHSSLFGFTRPIFNNPNDQQAIMLPGDITSIAVDWRYEIPNAAGDPTTTGVVANDIHPVVYVSGNAGVFRTTSKGMDWDLYPDAVHNSAPQEGGFLPNVRVTDIRLMLGNLNRNTGRTDHSTSLNLLMATTFGRGAFGIRLDDTGFAQFLVDPTSGPRIANPTLHQDVEFDSPAPGAVLQGFILKFDSVVDAITFTPADVRVFAPNGAQIPVTAVRDVTVVPVGALNPHNTFLISFPAQTAAGFYGLSFGPNLSDFGGNLMNQDGDTFNGEPVQDQFNAAYFFEPNTPPTIAPVPNQSTAPGVPLPITLSINDGQTPTLLRVKVTVINNAGLIDSIDINGQGNPAGGVVPGITNPVITITPGTQIGVATIQVEVSDPFGLAAQPPVIFTVAINNPPTLEPDPIPNVTRAHSQFPVINYVTLTGTDPDPLDTVTFVGQAFADAAFTQPLPGFVVVDANTGQVDLTPASSFVGTYFVRVGSTDGHATTFGSFTVTVINSAPTLPPLGNIAGHHRDFPLAVTLPGTDPDVGENLSYSAVAYDYQSVITAQLDQSLGLFQDKANYHFNKYKRKEKFLRGFGNIRYFILPDGSLFRFTGTNKRLRGVLVGKVTPAHYANPALLWNNPAPVALPGFVSTAGDTAILTPPPGFVGTFFVVATVSDGVFANSSAFAVSVFNNPPSFNAAIGSVSAHHSQFPLSRTLNGGDADGADVPFLTYSAQAFERNSYRARQLDAQLGLVPAKIRNNLRRRGEKYLKGAGNKTYYILPNGQLFQLRVPATSKRLRGTLIETFTPAYHANPNLLAFSPNPTVLPGFVNVSGNTINFTPQNFAGTYFVEAYVSDGSASATQVIQVDVTI